MLVARESKTMDDPQLEFGRDETEFEAAEPVSAKARWRSDPAGEAGWFLQREREKRGETWRMRARRPAFIPTMSRPSNLAT